MIGYDLNYFDLQNNLLLEMLCTMGNMTNNLNCDPGKPKENISSSIEITHLIV